MNPQKFSRGVPGALAEGPTARGTGGVISVLLPRERAWALRPLLRGGLGVGGPLGPFQTWMVTGVPGSSCIAPGDGALNPLLLGPRRCVSILSMTQTMARTDSRCLAPVA